MTRPFSRLAGVFAAAALGGLVGSMTHQPAPRPAQQPDPPCTCHGRGRPCFECAYLGDKTEEDQ